MIEQRLQSDGAPRRLLSVVEAAAYLGLSAKTIYAWIEEGRIPFVALGRRRMLDIKELDGFILRNTVSPWKPRLGR